jgi:AraC-like DNA-binding protein
MKSRSSQLPDVFAPQDPLGQALQPLRLSAVFYVNSEFTRPWGLDIPPMDGHLMFHVLLSGSCTLVVGEATRTLRAGDFVLVPHGDGHLLRDGASVRAEKLFDLPHDYVGPHFAHLRFGGGGPLTQMTCGVVRHAVPAARRLLDMLPGIVHVGKPDGPESRWIEHTLPLMADEALQTRPGGESLLTRLADIVVIAAIRSWLSSESELRAGLYAGLRDAQVGRALGAFHRNPERPWTLETLANAAAMSRSALAAKFAELVGEPAMQYVTRWRMFAAHAALRETGTSMAAIADRVGYRSEAAFSRAFKRVMGTSPGAVRQGALVDARA